MTACSGERTGSGILIQQCTHNGGSLDGLSSVCFNLILILMPSVVVCFLAGCLARNAPPPPPRALPLFYATGHHERAIAW